VVEPAWFGGVCSPEEYAITTHVLPGWRAVLADREDPGAQAQVPALVERADVLVESDRPGVLEYLGPGPWACSEQDPGPVLAGMTGWGQDAPVAVSAWGDG
jgi:alpha-methylacyl-CoA racemase